MIEQYHPHSVDEIAAKDAALLQYSFTWNQLSAVAGGRPSHGHSGGIFAAREKARGSSRKSIRLLSDPVVVRAVEFAIPAESERAEPWALQLTRERLALCRRDQPRGMTLGLSLPSSLLQIAGHGRGYSATTLWKKGETQEGKKRPRRTDDCRRRRK